MKLSKALKLKNRLVQEIKILQARVSQYNSYMMENKPPYDTKQALVEMSNVVTRLVRLKAKIAVANGPIMGAILEIAEMKGMISMLQNLNTKTGVQIEHFGFDDKPLERIHAATISRVEADQLIKEYTDRLDSLQEKIDEHNATVSIEE